MPKCDYCGSNRNVQAEHIQAQSKMRTSRQTIPACRICNQSKGSKALMEWLRWVKRNDRYRWSKISAYHKGKRGEISIKVQRIRNEK